MSDYICLVPAEDNIAVVENSCLAKANILAVFPVVAVDEAF
ncbi:hypothetical protein MY10362_004769 [Beauveria mimosiformis]